MPWIQGMQIWNPEWCLGGVSVFSSLNLFGTPKCHRQGRREPHVIPSPDHQHPLNPQEQTFHTRKLVYWRPCLLLGVLGCLTFWEAVTNQELSRPPRWRVPALQRRRASRRLTHRTLIEFSYGLSGRCWILMGSVPWALIL